MNEKHYLANLLCEVFYYLDPADLGTVENELYDEYDAEATEVAEMFFDTPKNERDLALDVTAVFNSRFDHNFGSLTETLVSVLSKIQNDLESA